MANVSNCTTFISLNNHLYMTRPSLIDLNVDEDNQGLRYYPFMINLEWFSGSYNTLHDPSLGYVLQTTQKM